MSAVRSGTVLAALGFDEDEEAVYRALASAGAQDADALAAATGLPRASVVAALDRLEGSGLAAVHGDGFAAAPPAIALGALLREQRDALHAAELDVAELTDLFRATQPGGGAGVVEVLTDEATVRHRFAQLQQAARREVRSFMVAGLRVVPPPENVAGDAGLRRGIVDRVVLHRDALEVPGTVAAVIASITQGQQVRVSDDVPVKMLIVDDDMAMVPLSRSSNTDPESVIVHPGGILRALVAYFEMAWERAYPLWPDRTGADLVELRPGEIDPGDGQVLALLLAGLTDEAVAGQLGMSLRTVQRRVRRLMDTAGVQTRLQLGWHAGRHGWV